MEAQLVAVEELHARPGDLAEQRLEVLHPLCLALRGLGDHLIARGFEDLVQPPHDHERKHDLAVVGALVVAAKQLGDAPDQVGVIADVGHAELVRDDRGSAAILDRATREPRQVPRGAPISANRIDSNVRPASESHKEIEVPRVPGDDPHRATKAPLLGQRHHLSVCDRGVSPGQRLCFGPSDAPLGWPRRRGAADRDPPPPLWPLMRRSVRVLDREDLNRPR